jgi:FkbM family methyltransferase
MPLAETNSPSTDMLRAKIAAHRDNPVLRGIAAVCGKYLRAYNNEANWNMRVNGEAEALRRVTRAFPGDVLDIGANVGQWAQVALPIVGDRPLHCFEMVPETFAALRRNIGAAPNVMLNNVGLGARGGTLEVHHCPAASVVSSAFAVDYGAPCERRQVAVIRGDDYIRERRIAAIAFAKIDVEGMEMEVLEGLTDSLRGGVIKAVQFEHAVAHVASRHFLRDFVQFFDGLGFAVFRCYPARLEALHYDMHSDEVFTGLNYLAVARPGLPALELSATP